MNKLIPRASKANFSLFILGVFWLTALLNPILKKYDYGVGFPMLMVFSLVLLAFLVLEAKKKREISGVSRLESVFLSIFGVFVALSFVFSTAQSLSLPDTVAYLSVIPFYLIFAHQRLSWRKVFLRAVVVGAYISVIIGFILYFFSDQLRMVGPFFNIFYHSNYWPNAFALFLLMAWPAVLLYFRQHLKCWHLVGLVFVISALFLTFSRAALIAFSGQLILLLIYFFKDIKWKGLLYILLIAVFSFGIFVGANSLRSLKHDLIDVKERIEFSNGDLLTSGQERIDFWLGSIELINEKPVFGWGPFSFRYAFNGIQKIFLGSSDHPHNIFLKIAVENGIPAAVAFISFLLLLFFVVILRFKKLSTGDREFVYILGVAVIGAFAHSLVDYNFNFLANLLLLFICLILIRSTVAKVNVRKKMPSIPLIPTIFALSIAFVCIFEGNLMFLGQFDKNHADKAYSLYPRYFYLQSAEAHISGSNIDYPAAMADLNKQIELNSLDDKAYYLRGVIYCNKDYVAYNLDSCRENLKKALELNPMNEIVYYMDYFRTLSPADEEFAPFLEESVALLNMYFGYVEKNMHFTAYTDNVENASDFVDLLLPYISSDAAVEFSVKRDMMLSDALSHRAARSY